MPRTLNINARDMDALARIAQAEAKSLGPEGMAGVIGTVLNRAAAGGYGNGIEGVINKPYQFSPINSVGHWSRLPEAGPEAKSVAQQIVAQMRDGAANPVGNSTHFYNPALASPKWGRQMEVQAQFGEGRNQHIHGTLPTDRQPGAYAVKVDDNVPLSQIAGYGTRPVPPRDVPGGGMLRYGNSGGRVMELQANLNAAGHNIAIDGKFGPETRGAVRSFQELAGLKPDGISGPQTQAALYAVARGPAAPAGPPGSQMAFSAQAVQHPLFGDSKGGPSAFNVAAGAPTTGTGYTLPFQAPGIPGASRPPDAGAPALNTPNLGRNLGAPIPTVGAFTQNNPTMARAIDATYGGNDPLGGPGKAYPGGAGGLSNGGWPSTGYSISGGRGGGGGGGGGGLQPMFSSLGGVATMAGTVQSPPAQSGRAAPIVRGSMAPNSYFPITGNPETLDETIELQKEIYRLQNPFNDPSFWDPDSGAPDPWELSNPAKDYTINPLEWEDPTGETGMGDRLALAAGIPTQMGNPDLSPWEMPIADPRSLVDGFDPDWANKLLDQLNPGGAPNYEYGVPVLPNFGDPMPTIGPYNPAIDPVFNPNLYLPSQQNAPGQDFIGPPMPETIPTPQWPSDPMTPMSPDELRTFGTTPGTTTDYPTLMPPSDFGGDPAGPPPYMDIGQTLYPSAYTPSNQPGPDIDNYTTMMHGNVLGNLVGPIGGTLNSFDQQTLANQNYNNAFLTAANQHNTANDYIEALNQAATNQMIIGGYGGIGVPNIMAGFGIYG